MRTVAQLISSMAALSLLPATQQFFTTAYAEYSRQWAELNSVEPVVVSGSSSIASIPRARHYNLLLSHFPETQVTPNQIRVAVPRGPTAEHDAFNVQTGLVFVFDNEAQARTLLPSTDSGYSHFNKLLFESYAAKKRNSGASIRSDEPVAFFDLDGSHECSVPFAFLRQGSCVLVKLLDTAHSKANLVQRANPASSAGAGLPPPLANLDLKHVAGPAARNAPSPAGAETPTSSAPVMRLLQINLLGAASSNRLPTQLCYITPNGMKNSFLQAQRLLKDWRVVEENVGAASKNSSESADEAYAFRGPLPPFVDVVLCHHLQRPFFVHSLELDVRSEHGYERRDLSCRCSFDLLISFSCCVQGAD